jgi:hypothetical protein
VYNFKELRIKLSAYNTKFESALTLRGDKKRPPVKSNNGSDLDPKQLTTLAQIVEDLENTVEFQDLVKETAQSFSPKNDKLRFLDLWSENVRAFFRRSHFYLSAYKRRVIDLDELLANYVRCKYP